MRRSLRTKTICAVLFSAFLLAGTAAVISYRVYSEAIYEQYETMTMNLARTTAVTVDAKEVRVLRDEVVRIYRGICEEYGGVPDFKQFTDEDWEAYYAGYASVYEMDAYRHILEQLNGINDANHVSSIYIGYMDTETLYGIYLVDGAAGADACPPGTCDPFEESNLERMEQGDYDFPAYVTNYEEYGWLCSAGAGIYDENGEVVATALVDISMEDVMKNRQDFLMNLCIVLAGITLFLLIVLIVLLGKIVLSPINSLAKAAASFVSEKEKHGEGGGQSAISGLEIHTGDEIEYLSDSIRQMEREINSYIENLTAVTAEKERMGAELNVATQIQASMLPCIFPAFPERNEFDIYASMEPAKEVGGDFYDFFMVDEDHLALVIADVSGKGVPAALFMVIAKALLQSNIKREKSLERAMEITNESLCANNKNGMFVTVWAGVLDISDGTLTYINAGHCHPLVKGKDGSVTYLKELGGFVLAGAEGMTYHQSVVRLCPGDILFQCSDGVTEANDCDGALYGEERLKRILELFGTNEPQDIINAVWNDICTYEGIAEQFDDITMLALRFNGSLGKNQTWCATPCIERMPDVINFMEDALRRETVCQSDRAKLLVAVDELYSNICRYSRATEAKIACHAVSQYVQIVFEDNGIVFNPLESDMPDITRNVDEREIGGLGIYMVRTMMDEVEYEYADGKNRLTIRLMR